MFSSDQVLSRALSSLKHLKCVQSLQSLHSIASLLHLKLQRVQGYELELPFLNGKLSLNLLGFKPALNLFARFIISLSP